MKCFTPRVTIALLTIVPMLLLLAVAQSVRSAPEPSTDAPRVHLAQAAPAAPTGERPVLSPEETHPSAKTLASQVALTLTTYGADEGPNDILARLPPSEAAPAQAASEALHHPGSWSRGGILYPQLGGLLPGNRASVMVVVTQQIGTPEGVRVETRTLDIRLRIVDGAWRFDHLASAGGVPVPPPAGLPPEAIAVLEHPGIVMPDSARWDIYSGAVSTTLLGVIARLANEAPIGITTLISGHPPEIFGTDRLSDHTRGRAVDVFRVGELPVIEERQPGSVTHTIASWLGDQPEIARLGSPWDFKNATAISFTDALHQDHLHIAVPRDAP